MTGTAEANRPIRAQIGLPNLLQLFPLAGLAPIGPSPTHLPFGGWGQANLLHPLPPHWPGPVASIRAAGQTPPVYEFTHQASIKVIKKKKE